MGIDAPAEPDLSSEQELISRMLAGDERAFDAFFETYFARVYRFALPRVGRDREAARDVVQTTLTKAVRKLAGFRGEATLFSWLCQICRHEISDFLRAQKRHDDNVILFEDSAEVRAALESIEAPESQAPHHRHGQSETRRLIQSVLDRLPARYGDALEWKYIDGRSVDEIAVLLGIGQVATQSLLARARTAFREAIEGLFGAEAADLLSQLR
jgi:RNA polymerase sigma-70 factor, ECF subfamily